MKKKFRIEDEELINKSHFPIKAVFDMVSDARFMEVLTGLSRGRGFGENYGACVFWNDLDDYDKEYTPQYEGAEFGLHNGEQIIIGYQDLFYYLTIICKKYCKEFPEETRKVETLLNSCKEQYKIHISV